MRLQLSFSLALFDRWLDSRGQPFRHFYLSMGVNGSRLSVERARRSGEPGCGWVLSAGGRRWPRRAA